MLDISPGKFLVIAAHPDDAVMGAGGTIRVLIEKGWRAYLLVLTNGEKGRGCTDLEGDALAFRRQNEQRADAEILGIEKIHFLGLPDGELCYNHANLGQIVHWIRDCQPDLVLTHDPSVIFFPRRDINNPKIIRTEPIHEDHRITGRLAVQARLAARNGLFFEEQLRAGLKPYTYNHLMLWDSFPQNHFVEIRRTHLARQVQAAACHTSQFPDSGAIENWLCKSAALVGQQQGMEYAEAFQYLELRSPL